MNKLTNADENITYLVVCKYNTMENTLNLLLSLLRTLVAFVWCK